MCLQEDGWKWQVEEDSGEETSSVEGEEEGEEFSEEEEELLEGNGRIAGMCILFVCVL